MLRKVSQIEKVCREAGLDLLYPFVSEQQAALIVGNSRTGWSIFRERCDPNSNHPIDELVERTLEEATLGLSADVRLAHQQPFIPIQRIAHDTGLAFLAPSNLSIHPILGPWFALRAVVYLADPPLPEWSRSAAANPCTDCHCEIAFKKAAGSDRWQDWLAVRDACHVGREHRYPDDQIAYHYTKDRSLLI